MSHEQNIGITPENQAPIPIENIENGERQQSPFLMRVREKIDGVKDHIKQFFKGNESDIGRETGEALTYMAEQTIETSGTYAPESVEAVVLAEVETVDDGLDENPAENPIAQLINDGFESTAVAGVVALSETDPAVAAAVAKDIDIAETLKKQEESAKCLSEALSSALEKEQTGIFYSKETIIGDAGHIEGQQYHIIRAPDGSSKIYFKLSEAAYDSATAKIETGEIATDGITPVHLGEIQTGSGDVIPLGETGAKLIVSRSRGDRVRSGLSDQELLQHSGWSDYQERQYSGQELQKVVDTEELPADKQDYESGLFRTLDRQVIVDLPAGISPEEASKLLNDIMSSQLGVEEAFSPPDHEATEQLKTQLYSWHHKLSPESSEIPLSKLERKEVFDGYSTMVEVGKSDEYEAKYGKFAFFHQLSSLAQLDKVLKTGVIATTERFGRGVTAHGKGSVADLKYGGADAAFTRMIAENNLEDDELWPSDAFLVLSPKLAERTDWHTHSFNGYGRADEENMAKRLSPDEMLSQMSENGFQSMDYNEQLFPQGISPDMISAVMVPDEARREQALSVLKSAGMTEFAGKPIEEFIVVANRRQDIIDLSHQQTSGQVVDLQTRTADSQNLSMAA